MTERTLVYTLAWIGHGCATHVLASTDPFSVLCNLRNGLKVIPLSGYHQAQDVTCRACLQKLFGLTWSGVGDRVTEMKRCGHGPSPSISLRIERRREANTRRMKAIQAGFRRQRQARL